MKFLDKETVIVLILAVLILIGWGVWTKHQANIVISEQPKQTVSVSTADVKKTTPPAVERNRISDLSRKESHSSVVAKPMIKSVVKNLPPVTLTNDCVSVQIDPVTCSVQKVLLKRYKTSDRKSSIIIDSVKAPGRTAAAVLDGWTLTDAKIGETDTGRFLTVARTFRHSSEELVLTQSFALPSASYFLNMKWKIENPGKTAVTLPELQIWTTGLPPMKYLGGDQLYNPVQRVEYFDHVSGKMISEDSQVKEEKFKTGTGNAAEWVGSTNKYFASLLIPESLFDGGCAIKRSVHPVPNGKDDVYYIPSIAGVYKNVMIPAGGTKEYAFRYFAGPKTLEEVRKMPASAMPILHLSYFSAMEYLARPILWLLNVLKNWCGSYGIAIILLTLIVRIVFFPLTERGNRSMRKMQKVAPKAKEIREKYKDNPQLMNQKTMELYREEGVNPLGGCLPILLQIPVFFALYAALDSAVELRHVSFLWATDLTKPDLVGPQFFLGYGIHPLVLIMTALMIVQQKMTPANMDPAQQKMMLFMPVIMLFFLYNLPSGLTLYWTVSQIFSILQMKYSLYIAQKEEAKNASPANS